MNEADLERELRLVISGAGEHERKKYVITIAVCCASDRKRIKFGVFITHNPKKFQNALSETALRLLIAETTMKHGMPMSFMIRCVVDGVPRERAVQELVSLIHEHALTHSSGKLEVFGYELDAIGDGVP